MGKTEREQQYSNFLLLVCLTKYFLVSFASLAIAIADDFRGHDGKRDVQHKDSQRNRSFARISVDRAIR
jgi:hypothetical protein